MKLLNDILPWLLYGAPAAIALLLYLRSYKTRTEIHQELLQESVAAGLMVFLIGHVLCEYKGALFWKMTAGMGDVVIAPVYEVLRRRGVRFEFFHRVDALHLDADRRAIDTITLGRQVRLANGIEQYDPLTVVKGLPVFPNLSLIHI